MGRFMVEQALRPRHCHRCDAPIPALTYIMVFRHTRYCKNMCPACVSKVQFEVVKGNAGMARVVVTKRMEIRREMRMRREGG